MAGRQQKTEINTWKTAKENGAEKPITTTYYTRDRTVLVREKKQNKTYTLSLSHSHTHTHAPTHALYSEAVKIPFLSLRFQTTSPIFYTLRRLCCTNHLLRFRLSNTNPFPWTCTVGPPSGTDPTRSTNPNGLHRASTLLSKVFLYSLFVC